MQDEKKQQNNEVAPDILESDDQALSGKAGLEGEKTLPVSEVEYRGLIKDQQELKESKERLLRAAADFENTKKRLERQKEEFVQFANKNLLSEFLPIMDNLDRAIASAKKAPSVESLLQGLDMINKQLLETLRNHGLVKMEVIGKPFDPNHHEAIGTVETDEHEDETVVEEISSGYLYKELLLKPALVKISSKKSSDSEMTERTQ